MTNLAIRKQQMLERVRAFGATHRDLFPTASFAGRMFAAVAEASDAVRRHATAEMSGSHSERQGSEEKAAARTALRRRLSGISGVARAVAFEMPGFDQRFKVRFDCSDQRLLAHARSFVESARPLARTFMEHDMAPHFLAQLQADIDAFEQAIRTHHASRDRRVAAQVRIDAEIRKGLQAATRLAAIVPAKIEDPAMLAVWNAARRIGYPPRIKKPVAA